MMKPTRDQIIEGRDEALEHLGIDPCVFDAAYTKGTYSQIEMVRRHALTDLDMAAALTVACAQPGLDWALERWRLFFNTPRRQSDYTLQA